MFHRFKEALLLFSFQHHCGLVRERSPWKEGKERGGEKKCSATASSTPFFFQSPPPHPGKEKTQVGDGQRLGKDATSRRNSRSVREFQAAPGNDVYYTGERGGEGEERKQFGNLWDSSLSQAEVSKPAAVPSAGEGGGKEGGGRQIGLSGLFVLCEHSLYRTSGADSQVPKKRGERGRRETERDADKLWVNDGGQSHHDAS